MGVLGRIGQLQDPWAILNTTLLMIMDNSVMFQPEMPPFPIFGCDCAKNDCTILAGGMEYCRTGTNPFVLKNVNCPACGDQGRTIPLWLPE